MKCRQLDINVMWADNLKAVTLFSKKPKAYVEVWAGDPVTKYRTRVVRGGNNHRWDDRFSFPIDAATLKYRCLVLDVKSKSVLGVRDVGRVVVPLKALFDDADAAAERVVEFQVCRPSGNPSGTLRFSYKFWDKISGPAKTVGQVTADQANVGAVTGYPPAPAYGHGYPPQPTYGHAPATYGYPPPVVQAQPPKPRRKWKTFVLRLAEQLGMRWAVDYMISDASEMAGYDAGFGDADFDF